MMCVHLMFAVLLLLALSLQAALGNWRECTADEAAVDGRFSCIDGCDGPDHVAYGWLPYCLSYFPNDGVCHLKPYDREALMTCNGQVGGTSDPPLWFVFIGGSNNYFMFKVILDILLELPADAGYDPKLYWNATDFGDTGEILESEIAIMDFVWDAERRSIRRSAWWWEGWDCYYCLPFNTREIFLDVPHVTMGSFRISYLNIHYADEFIDRFDLAVANGSDWTTANPTIHVNMEWTGFWGDWDAPVQTHEDNLRHLQNRIDSEGLNIASFVMTDSAGDCNSGRYDNVANILEAFDNVETDFPKHYFSKRDMQYDEYQLTGNCMTNGHTLEPLNSVIANRYFNMICNSNEPDETFHPTVPVCVSLVPYNYQCFQTDNGWMSNLFEVCPVTYLDVANRAPAEYCALTDVEEEETVPFPVCTALPARYLPDADEDADTASSSNGPRDTNIVGFDAFVYTIFALCVVFVLVESLRSITVGKGGARTGLGAYTSPKLREPRQVNVKAQQMEDIIQRYSGPDLEGQEQPACTPPSEEVGPPASAENGDNLQGSLSLPITFAPSAPEPFEQSPAPSPVPADLRSLAWPPAQPAKQMRADGATAGAHANGASAAVSSSDGATAGALPLFADLGKKLNIFFSFPDAVQSDRFEAIGFARFLASVHIVLGHMYQASHLSTFHSFNRFGFTWVPWFFLLSGYILTHTEKKRRDKLNKTSAPAAGVVQPASVVDALSDAAVKQEGIELPPVKSEHSDPASPAAPAPAPAPAASSNNAATATKGTAQSRTTTDRPMGLIEYVNHRMRTLYPLYLVGICAAIATVWAVKGAPSLPAPTDVLLYVLLMQGWVPSILEKGLVYLVQCWFLSCLLFYWFLFYEIYDRLSPLTDQAVLMVAFTASVLLPLLYQLITFTIAGWTDNHEYLSTDGGVDIAVVVLKFTPLSYLHIFVLGCCLPRVREVLLRLPKVEYALPWVCTVSYGILIAIYLTVGEEVPGYLLSFRLGLVSIVQCALLIGLCNGQDLLGRLFCQPLLKQLGQYGFAQYIFQFIVYAWFSFATQQSHVDVRYFLLLFSTSVIVWTAVMPFNGERMNKFVLALVPVFIAYLMMQPFFANYEKTNGSGDSSSGAEMVFPQYVKSDALLPIVVTNDVFTEGYLSETHMFNPSINTDTPKPIFVARRDRVVTTGATWYGKEYQQQRWESEIVYGSYDEDRATQSAVILKHENFVPCAPPLSCSNNGSLTMKVSYGPEDPRLFVYQGQQYVSVFSYDNIYANTTATAKSTYGAYGSGTKLCSPAEDGLIGRMYIAKVATVQANPCILTTFLPVVQDELLFTNYSIVKNWLVFAADNETGYEELYFIHQISPLFTVMRVRDFGEEAVHTEVAYTSTTPAAIRKIDLTAQKGGKLSDYTLVQQDASVLFLTPEQRAYQTRAASDLDVSVIDAMETVTAIHGSTNPIFIDGWRVASGQDHFLSIFHTVSAESEHNYVHYTFTFCPYAPFEIASISAPLTLTTTPTTAATAACGDAPFAFVTSASLTWCTNDDDDGGGETCVLLSYGVCDLESRVMEIRLRDWEKTFTKLRDC